MRKHIIFGIILQNNLVLNSVRKPFKSTQNNIVNVLI